MAIIRKRLAAAAVGGILAGGVLIGGVALAAGPGGAGDPGADLATAHRTADGPPGGPGRPGPPRGAPLDLSSVAGALNLTEDALRQQLRSGKTLAQVADAQGVTRATLVDAITAALKKARPSLTDAQAAAQANRIADGTGPAGGRGGCPGGPGRGGAPSRTTPQYGT